MLHDFFVPYLSLCHLASWGLAQNLQGLGLFKYFNSLPIQVGEAAFYPLTLDPLPGVVALSLVLTVVLLTLLVINIRACFYLNKWVGFGGLILWMLPGIFSMLGYTLDIRDMGPDVFRFSDGFPGGMESAAANLLLCLIGGWSFILLLSSFWKKNTFKNAFDHVWYSLGLVAALYWVVDAGLPSYKEDLKETENRFVRTLQLYQKSEARLMTFCALPDVSGQVPDLCALAPRLSRDLADSQDLKQSVHPKMALADWTQELAEDPALANQIQHLNDWACVQGHHREMCETISAHTALSVEEIFNPIAFPPPLYAQAIKKFHASLAKTDARIHEIERGHNLRYFGFMAVAILAGGKLANASRALVNDDSVRPRSWVLTIIKKAAWATFASTKHLARLGIRAYRRLTRKAAVGPPPA